MAETGSQRPPLPSNNTLDADQLTGKLLDTGEATLTAEANGKPSATRTETRDFGESSSAIEDEDGSDDTEDYDNMELDPDTLVANRRSLADINDPGAAAVGGLDGMANGRTSTETTSTASRRKSIQVKLERTDRKGRYILTADDPEIKEILRKGVERDQLQNGEKKPRVRFRDLVFTRQFTTFDRQNPASSESPFFGFFTLFWLAMVLMFIRVAMHNWRDYGSILGPNQIAKMMFSHDVFVLGLTDGVMTALTAEGLVFQKMVKMEWINWARSGWIIQNVWQVLYLATVYWWTWYREWPWTHTIFVTLHGLVFVMKQHSYSFYNGYLSGVYRRRRLLQQKLKDLDNLDPHASRPTSPVDSRSRAQSPAMTSGREARGSMKRRRPSMGMRTSTNLTNEKSDVASVASAIESGSSLDINQLQAFKEIIESDIEDLTHELQGKATTPERAYPNNLTFFNFAEWTCLPTLTYELEYPRQDRINWWYVLEKTTATFGVLCVMMVISQAYIYPPVAKTVAMKEAGMSVQERWAEFPYVVADMLFPLLLEQLLTWYLIWECVLNVLAELTRFADRGFYGDWWNSVSWDQYARDWNRPVHNFLLRHVYHSSISTFHLSKTAATFVTFLLSALVHELVMAVMFKKVRGYLFTMQLLQMPLVMLSKTKLLKGKAVLGNVIFWLGLFVGPSFLTSLYLIL